MAQRIIATARTVASHGATSIAAGAALYLVVVAAMIWG